MTKSAARPKSVITEPMKLFIVRQLASYDQLATVSAAVLEEFGVKLNSQQIERYHPERAAGRELGQKLKAEFYRARKAFEEDLDGIPEAKRAVRIRLLSQAARRAEKRGNDIAMADHLERIAKEVGGAHDNKRVVQLTGANGGAIESKVTHDIGPSAIDLVRETLGELMADEPDAS